MADIYSREKRSDIMSRIRSKGTKPEARLLGLVHQAIGKKRKIIENDPRLPGKPDITVPSLHLAIFCDGCFYHVCPRHGHIPKTNQRYWRAKLETNIRRDRANRARLRRMGYAVWRFWEHDLKPARIENTYAVLKRRLLKRLDLLKGAPMNSVARRVGGG